MGFEAVGIGWRLINARGTCSNPFEALIFSGFLFVHFLSSVYPEGLSRSLIVVQSSMNPITPKSD